MDALTLFSSNNSSCFYNDYDEGCACAVMGRVRMRSDGEKRVCAFSGKKKCHFVILSFRCCWWIRLLDYISGLRDLVGASCGLARNTGGIQNGEYRKGPLLYVALCQYHTLPTIQKRVRRLLTLAHLPVKGMVARPSGCSDRVYTSHEENQRWPLILPRGPEQLTLLRGLFRMWPLSYIFT